MLVSSCMHVMHKSIVLSIIIRQGHIFTLCIAIYDLEVICSHLTQLYHILWLWLGTYICMTDSNSLAKN